MKTTRLDLPVMASWMELDGRRLNGIPYLSGAFEAKVILEKLSAPKEPLWTLTKNGKKGIFNGPRFARNYVDDPRYGIPLLSGSEMLQADISLAPLISKRQAESMPHMVLEEGTTLISSYGTIGRSVYCRSDMAGMIGSDNVMKIVPDRSKIAPGYLFAFLSSKFGIPLVVAGTSGSVVTFLDPSRVATVNIPRLGDAIEAEVHELVEEAAKLRTEALKFLYRSGDQLLDAVQLKELPAKYQIETPLVSEIRSSSIRMRLDGAFHSPLAVQAEEAILNSNCDVFPLGDARVTEKLFKPNMFKRLWAESTNYGSPFVSGNDIYRMTPSPERYISRKFEGFNNYLLKKGWVVFQAAGQLNGIFGLPILVNSYIDGMFCADDVFRIVPHSKSDAGYIYAYLRTNYGQRMLRRQAYGYSIPRVVAEHVEQILIPWAAESIRQKVGQSVVNAWEDIAQAIELETQANKLVEDTIEAAGRLNL